MDTATYPSAPHHIEEHEAFSVFGFWVFIMTDCVVFSALFATFAVCRHAYAGGSTGHDLFDLREVLGETVALLLSSVTCGFMMLAVHRRTLSGVLLWLAVTFLFGFTFIGLEVHEFVKLVHNGHGPERSAFLSAFFTLVGTHGLHVTTGLIWMAILAFQMRILGKGLSTTYVNRLMCFSLFWHFLDIVWVCVFTFVYLMGSVA